MKCRIAFCVAVLVGITGTPSLATQQAAVVRPFIESPDFKEDTNSAPVQFFPAQSQAIGPIAPATTQPAGALSGRIVFTSGGHGWTWNGSTWSTQRGVTEQMNEDYGNLDQMTIFAYYCFNAGAMVVTFRPVGHQTNEVILDNDDPGVTFNGSWSDSSSTIFYGSAGDVPYRFASVAASETATATYTPNIPLAGFYPVYTWVRHGTDRTNQLYRINHTGGQSLVRVPHNMAGSGWIYLGTYYFNTGSNTASGAVIISNLGPVPGATGVVIADAIRFGNGMGDINRGGGVSTYPREEECSRYWVQKMVGQGQSATLYDPDYPSVTTDDDNDNVGAPIRMAREMNSTSLVTNMFKRIYLGFHSNAGGGKGCIGLYNDETLFPGTATPNQVTWARIVSTNLDYAMKSLTVPPLELAWENNRSSPVYARSDYAFGEINDSTIGGEFDATIIEVAFHDDPNNAKLLRDPKVRNWMARASYQAVVKYMSVFDGGPTALFPEPPAKVRAIATTNGVTISWSAPVAMFGSGAPTNYLVYRSSDGYGFGNPASVGGTGTTLTLTNVAADADFYFRVSAVNAGGESMPSETVGCRRASSPGAAKILFVNAFDRFDRTLDLRQTPAAQNYKPPGHNNNTGTMDRVIPRSNNSFDYVVAHGKAISAYGMAFDSCENEAVSGGQINLTNYPIVIWACGNESTADKTFTSAEQSKVTASLAAGGSLFVSGAEIGWDLDRPTGPVAADRNFIHNQLHAAYTNDDSGSYTATAVGGGIFAGRSNATLDDGSKGIYWVGYPDVLIPSGSGASAALNYSGVTTGAAAIQYDGSNGGGKVVYFGFPFETITSATRRNNYMADILNFFLAGLPPWITAQPQSRTVNQGENATFTLTATGTALSYQWRLNGANIGGATASSFEQTNAQPAHAGGYAVVLTNSLSSLTSAVAMLTVKVPAPVKFEMIDLSATNQVRVFVSSEPGSSVTLYASSNLVEWIVVTNLVNTSGTVGFSESLSGDAPQRFYRASSP